MVGTVGEQLVVASTSHQLGARVLFLFEDQSRAILVDVKAVLDDGPQLDLERVVVDDFVARNVDLQRGWLRTSQVTDSNGSQPQRAHNLLKVWGKVGMVGHRFGDRNDILLSLRAQGAVVLVGDRIEQRTDT